MSASQRLTIDVIHCNVEFAESCFYPYGPVCGYVYLQLPTPKEITSIILDVKGVEHCEWLGKRSRNHVPHSYSALHEFLSIEEVLLPEDPERTIMEAREHEYTFSVQLPSYLPGTWIGKFGSIAYHVVVTVTGPKMSSRLFTRDFLVEHYRDLTQELRLRFDCSVTVHRTYYNVFIPLGTVTVSVWIPISGFVPGQGIPILCQIDNDSKIGITGIVFVVTKIEMYQSDKPRRSYKKVREDVCRVARTADAQRGTFLYFCVLLLPKTITPTQLFHKCKTNQVKYELWISVQPALPPKWAYGYPNIDTPRMPIVIGSVPIETWDSKKMTQDIRSFVSMDKDQNYDSIMLEPSDISLLAKLDTTFTTKSRTKIEHHKRMFEVYKRETV